MLGDWVLIDDEGMKGLYTGEGDSSQEEYGVSHFALAALRLMTERGVRFYLAQDGSALHIGSSEPDAHA